MKSLKDISWQVSEEEYRADAALSYSTLAKYERTGFNGLKNLFDKIETSSLTFGSVVDSIITGGEEEFNERFYIANIPNIKESEIPIVKELFSHYGGKFSTLSSIPDKLVIEYAVKYNFQRNWRDETKARVIKEEASEYYNQLYLSTGKTIIDIKTYQDACNSVDALKNNSATKYYFQKDNPWDGVERFYQLKFKHKLNGIWYRCMADLIIVNHKDKTIIPVDLKTSSHNEWDFYKSFIEWSYSIQARLYWRIIRAILDEDDIYKDYKLENYRFIVVNRYNLKPMVWEFNKTQSIGDITFGKYDNIVLRDPEVIGRELYTYMSENRKVPIGINEVEPNNIDYWLNTL